MEYLTNTDIDNTCLAIIARIKEDYPYYYPHILVMYYTGCRIGELFDYHITYNGTIGKIEIQPQKKNNLRILPMYIAEMPILIEQLNLVQDNFWLNKRNLQRIIEKVHPIRHLKCGNKKIGAHLFRHNWIKKQLAQGQQIASIDYNLGYTKQTIADTYAVSRIYY